MFNPEENLYIFAFSKNQYAKNNSNVRSHLSVNDSRLNQDIKYKYQETNTNVSGKLNCKFLLENIQFAIVKPFINLKKSDSILPLFE